MINILFKNRNPNLHNVETLAYPKYYKRAGCETLGEISIAHTIPLRRGFLTIALRQDNRVQIYDQQRRNSRSSGVNSDVVALAQRFAMLMSEYNQSIEDGVISVNEAKRLLRETVALQQVLLEMKLNLEEESA